MIHAREDYNRIQDPAHKIPADEPVFLLRAQDELACKAVAYYASLCEAAQAPEIAAKARSHSDAMAAWPIKKTPDLPTTTQPTASNAGEREATAIGHIRDALLRALRYVPPERESQMIQALSELEALATKPPAKCAHQFHYFGDQQTRRCMWCGEVESGEQKPVGQIVDPGNERDMPLVKWFARVDRGAHLYTAPAQPEQVAQDSAVLAYLDDLKDDAIAHIWPDDLERCQTCECTVTVASVRLGSPNGHTLPLFSRKQVADALRAARARGESKS